MYIIDLDKAYGYKELVGNKAYYLSLLKKFGFNTPNGFVITTKAVKEIEKLEDEIINALRKHNYEYYSVRSSSPLEDTEKEAKAGRFISFIRVEREKVLEKIFELANFAKKNKIPLAILVTNYVEGNFHGVGFSKNPSNREESLIEISRKKVTEGFVDVRYRFGNEIKREFYNINFLDWKIEELMKKINEDLKKIEKLLEKPVDTEFVIKENIVFLQARPITKFLESKTNKLIVISDGKAEGKIVKINSEEELKKLNEKSIIFVDRLYFWINNYLDKVLGIIVKKPSFTCHLAINLREKNIPCIALENIDGNYVIINTYQGKVEFKNL